MKVIMSGVDDVGKGGMWTVVENYLQNSDFCEKTQLLYMPTASAGSKARRIVIFLKGLLRIRKALKSGQYDIVHLHLSERGSLTRKRIIQDMAHKAGCKTILHMHGADFEDWYRSCAPGEQQHIRDVISAANKVLILGEYWRQFIGSLMTDQNRLEVLYNAVPVPKASSFSTDSKDIMFLGALIERKGIFDLIRAYAGIKDKLPAGCKLVLCGSADQEAMDAAHALATKERVDDVIEWKGWITPEARNAVMDKAAVNVLPSYREGLPMTILETMAGGIPNITTNVAAIPEAIEDNVNGVLIAPGDAVGLAAALLNLLTDDETRQRYSQVGLTIMRARFSLDAHIDHLLDIYAAMCVGEKSPPNDN